MKKIISKSYLIVALMILGMGFVHAASVGFTASGDVESADAGNAFLLTDTSTISASGVFDDSGFTGSGLESFDTTLSLTVGSVSFTEADEIGDTQIVFQDGSFLGFHFTTGFGNDIDGPIAFFDSAFDFFNGEDDNMAYMDGTWNSTSYAVVPVPAALWLFGSGLIALVGFMRRK